MRDGLLRGEKDKYVNSGCCNDVVEDEERKEEGMVVGNGVYVNV